MTPATHLPPSWARHLLIVLGCPIDLEKLRFLNAWARAEGGDAIWNPLNTTFELPGTTDYNSTGVKNYPRPIWGIAATALTLTSPAMGPLRYAKILGHLQARAGSNTAEQILEACLDDLQAWGTDPDLLRRVLAS